jgi:hypothetical protein
MIRPSAEYSTQDHGNYDKNKGEQESSDNGVRRKQGGNKNQRIEIEKYFYGVPEFVRTLRFRLYKEKKEKQ